MCTLTIDEIDDVLEHEINAKAQALGLSRAETVKKILTDTLLISKIDERRKMFAPFLGIWTDKDISEFEAVTRDLEAIDRGDWK
jgi:hypothetical protein